MEKRSKSYLMLLIFVLLIIILIFQIAIMFKVNDVSETSSSILQIEANLNDLNNQLYSVTGNVDHSLEQFMEEQSWIQNTNYKIQQVNMDKKIINVKFDWNFRELSNDETVSFLYRDKSESEWVEIEAKNSGGLNYYIEKTLPLMANYETQVIAKSKTGQRAEMTNELNIKDLINNRLEINAYFHKSREGVYEADVNINNDYYYNDEFLFENSDALKIKKANAIFVVNGKVVDTKNLLDETESSSWESIDMYYTIDLNENKEIDTKKIENVQLKIVVEDYLGFKYEKLAQY